MTEPIPVYYRPINIGMTGTFDGGECPHGGRLEIGAKVGWAQDGTAGLTQQLPGWTTARQALPTDWTGPELMCVGGTLDFVQSGRPSDTAIVAGATAVGRFGVTHDGESDEIRIYFGAPRQVVRAPSTDVPITFQPIVSHEAGARFDESSCPRSGTVEIHATTGDTSGLTYFAGSELVPVEHRHINGDGTVFVSGHLRGPYFACTGGSIELLADAGNDWTGHVAEGRFAVTHDGLSDEIVVTFGVYRDRRRRPKRPNDPVPIIYQPAAPEMMAAFGVSRCGWGERVVVSASVFDNMGGNVFAGVVATDRPHHRNGGPVTVTRPVHAGDYFLCEGGEIELLFDDGNGWSGDVGRGDFAITHDGASEQIVVTYATRPD